MNIVWTRQRTNWHDHHLGWISLPPGVRCHRVWLEDLLPRERVIFETLLKRHPGHLIVRLVGRHRVLSRNLLLEVRNMMNATDLEKEAMTTALRPLGEFIASIGMHRPLADYSKEEVLNMIKVVVSSYQDYFQKHNDDIPF
ncbi:MAG: hypothetical protein HQL84_17135 [Magnetococcales bacterium]|nr:hypothetical protein [Magnetococcales bacterium]MBF0151745.1 hypothetical protein [Magnetococcales bacterium]